MHKEFLSKAIAAKLGLAKFLKVLQEKTNLHALDLS
jgi:hypothetical protein